MPDPRAAIEFYTTILPWTITQMDMAGLPYYIFVLGTGNVPSPAS